MPHSLDNLRVILVTPRNSLNIGAAARALSNFGALHLRLVNPFEPSFREAVSAVGASHILQSAEVCSSVPEAIADCSLVVGTTAVGNRELLHPPPYSSARRPAPPPISFPLPHRTPLRLREMGPFQ